MYAQPYSLRDIGIAPASQRQRVSIVSLQPLPHHNLPVMAVAAQASAISALTRSYLLTMAPPPSPRGAMFLMSPSDPQPSSASLSRAFFPYHLVICSDVQPFSDNIMNPVSEPSSHIANTLCIYYSPAGGLLATDHGLLPYCQELYSCLLHHPQIYPL